MDTKHSDSTSTNDASVSFRPITEGLGFHPFSDGLPYAPMSKNPKSLTAGGTGAIAAGPPRMASRIQNPPSPPTASISVPVIKKEVVTSALQSPRPAFKNENRGIAYVAARSLAYLFDVSLNSLTLGGILITLVWKGELEVDQLLSYGVFTGVGVFFLVSGWALIAIQEILFRSSLGKYLFHLRFVGARFKIVLRTLLFPLSVGIFGLGILGALFHARRSCWHDLLTGIQPVECDKG